MTKKRWWMLFGLVAAAALVAAVVILSDSAMVVETAPVTRGEVTVTVDEEGRTRVRDRYVVAAPVAGRLTRIAVDEGDRVSDVDPLAQIHPTPADPREVGIARSRLAGAGARRSEAAAQVENARAAAEQADKDLERMENLAEARAVTRSELDQARLAATNARRQLESREAALQAAEAEVAAARSALVGLSPDDVDGATVPVVAPTAGRVLRVLEKSARVVQAGTPLIEIGDASGLEVVVDVLSEDAVRIEPGDPVRIERWGGDRVLEGAVRLVEPEAFTKVSALGVEEQRVNVVIDLAHAPPSLGAGYRVEARIVTWSGEDVLRVPTSALFQNDGSWAVFAVEDGRAALRTVRVGHQSEEAAEILDGLTEEDRVILYPSPLIEEGVAVRSGSNGAGS